MTLTELKQGWTDDEAYHNHINELFIELVNKDHQLNTHRNFVERGYGFGERAFWWLWKLICDEQPQGFSFLEIGCYKGGTISLIKLLRPDATVHTVTPLTGEGGYGEADYKKDVKYIHQYFGCEQPNIIHGLSTEDWVIQAVKDLGKWDVIYVDGDHSYDGCTSDLNNYAHLVKKGGLLVMDDANSDINMPHGFFRGHQTVTDAKLNYMNNKGDEWEFICSVVHISVFRRK